MSETVQASEDLSGEILGLLRQGVGVDEMVIRLRPSGADAVRAGLRLTAERRVSGDQAARLVEVVRGLPGWRPVILDALAHADLETSLAAARIGWSRNRQSLSRRTRENQEQERLQANRQQENRSKLLRLQGRPVVLTMREGMRRKGVLVKFFEDVVYLQTQASLMGRQSPVRRQIPLADIVTVEPDSGN